MGLRDIGGIVGGAIRGRQGAAIGELAGDVADKVKEFLWDDDDLGIHDDNNGNPSTSERDHAYVQHSISVIKRALG